MPLYEPKDEEIAIAAAKLADAFGGYHGFPASEKSLLMIAKGFCRIVWQCRTSEIPLFHGEAHPKIGDVIDDDWLIEQALECFQKFPSLIQLRKMYEEFLPPHDGRSSTEMGV